MKIGGEAHFSSAASMDGSNESAVKDPRARKRSSKSRRRTVRHLFQGFGMLGRKAKGKPTLQDLYGNVFEIIPDTLTQFEPTCAPFSPAVVREAAHIFRWKDNKEAENEPKSMDFMRKEKEMLFGREHGSEAISKIQRSNDMKIASRIMVQVRRSNLMENILTEEKNILIKQFFENGFQDPNQTIMEALNDAMEACYNECMARLELQSIVFDDEMKNFLSDKEKAKRVLLDAILKCPEYVPLIWGGRQPAETVKDVLPTELTVEELVCACIHTEADKSCHSSQRQAPNYGNPPKTSQQTKFDFMSSDKEAVRNQGKQQASFGFMSADKQAVGNQRQDGSESDSEEETRKAGHGTVQQKQPILSFDKACKSIMTVIPVEKTVKQFGTFIEQRVPSIPRYGRKEGVQKNSKEVADRRNYRKISSKSTNESQTFAKSSKSSKESQTFANRAEVGANGLAAGKDATVEKGVCFMMMRIL
ncbi:hypothetical protein Aduo_011449 [Ancylostoma duodenale]